MAMNAGSVEAVRRLGLVFERGGRLLSVPLFKSWIGRHCFSESTVRNYRRVARLSKQDSAFYDRCAALDPSNVYALLAQPRDLRGRILDATLDGACSTDLGVADFRLLIRQVVARPPRRRDDTLFAGGLPSRAEGFALALRRALSLPPARFAAVRRDLLRALEPICPLANRLRRRLGAGVRTPQPQTPLPAPTPQTSPPPQLAPLPAIATVPRPTASTGSTRDLPTRRPSTRTSTTKRAR